MNMNINLRYTLYVISIEIYGINFNVVCIYIDRQIHTNIKYVCYTVCVLLWLLFIILKIYVQNV